MSLLPSGAIETGGYDINNSLRFRSATSAYLLRTPASAGNRKTFTISFWFKRGTLGVDQKFLSAYSADSDSGNMDFRLTSGNILYWGPWSTGMTTAAVFRDPSAWYHVVLTIDTTQATGANRHRVYVNGVEYTFSGTPVTQNTDLAWNNTIAHNIGRNARTSGDYFDGYMTEFYSIDGQALTPSSFGETDAITGVWKPKKYTGTYGTNGFYLKFANDSSSLSYQYGALLNGSSQYVSLTPTSAFNFSNNNWTIEAFVWPNSQTNQVLFNYGFEGSTNRAVVIYYTGGTLNLAYSTNGTNNTDTSFGAHNMQSNQWNHVAVVRNGTTITAYVNGIPLPTTITIGTSSINYPGTSGAFRIGRDSTGYLNAFIHGFRIVNGTAVYTSKFKPTTTKLTAIANTQLLTLQDATLIDNSPNNFTLTNNGSFTISYGVVPYAAPSIAADYSGNYNNWFIGTGWNVNDISDQSYSVMYDSPTLTSTTVANYATLNPLDFASASGTLSAGNLNWASSTNVCGNKSTIGATSGKWYWEAVGSSVTSGTIGGRFGFTGSDTIAAEQDKFGMYWHPTSGIARIVNGTNTYVTSAYTYTNSDVLALALDLDNNISYWYKNGVLQYTYDFSSYSTIGSRVFHAYVWNASSGTPSWVYNFGQRPFAYTPRTNHLALNTYNLPTPTILQGNKYMDATLYTGTGTSQVTVNAGQFKPDFVWLKSRSNAYNHELYDSVRGVQKRLVSNLTNAESTSTNGLTAFNSNGFTQGGEYETGLSGNYVGWQWQAGQGSTSSNTSGSITSTVSVNTTAGFSIVTWTGNGTNGASIGHGLGVTPAMVIFKSRGTGGSAYDWPVYHKSLAADNYLVLNSTVASAAASGVFTLSSTLITFTTSYASTNASANTMVAYCWAEIAGFSKFGSYTGNGSADGPFVFTNFRPKYILVKSTGTASWFVIDTARLGYNSANNYLLPNATTAETTYNGVDILSNGFKVRNTDSGYNDNGVSYIYACFAENPFKNSLAR